MTAMLLLWVIMGLFAGYASARLYKAFQGTDWKLNTLKTAFMFPGFVFVIFFFLNALIWEEKSSGAVPFGTMVALVFLWFGISVPLVSIGSYYGFKKPVTENPVRTNKIPRQIPEQAWYMRPVFSILIGGILPFGAVFIERFFILTSIWLHQFYYIFGFLFIVFLILIVTCAEITIVLCYFQLCSEDYDWWWRAYLTSGSSAVYLFLCAAFYFFNKLSINKVVSGKLYFGYMSVAMLETLRLKHGIQGPFLVVAPVSTLGHWQREVESLTDMNCVVYSGSFEDREIIRDCEFKYDDDNRSSDVKFNVLLTSFEMLMKDQNKLVKISWQFVIVDEAHRWVTEQQFEVVVPAKSTPWPPPAPPPPVNETLLAEMVAEELAQTEKKRQGKQSRKGKSKKKPRKEES